MIKNCEFHVIENGGHEFYDQPFEDAMGYILQYLDRQMKGGETVENREDESQMEKLLSNGDETVTISAKN